MKLRALSLLSSLTCLLMVHTASAATATDTQTLTLTVPLVALIDVEDISPTFTFIAPTNAGDGFTGALTATNNMPTVAISSNNSAAKLQISTSNNNLSSAQISLQVMTTSGLCNGFSQVAALTTTPQNLCTIGMLKTTNGNLIISANPGISNSMIPYGNHTTDIIYTLTQN